MDTIGVNGRASDMQQEKSISLENYVAHVARCSRVVWIDGEPWEASGRQLKPLTNPHTRKPVDRVKVREAMRQTGCRLARWTDSWDTEPCPWWWVACDDKEYDVSKLPRGGREAVRKGLRQCEVRRIEPAFFAQHGHLVYLSAAKDYGRGFSCLSADQFAAEVMRNAGYEGRETWGVFHGEKLIGYASCIVVEDVAYVSASKSIPEYHKLKPNNACQYTVMFHYLRERGLLYVASGTRPIHHEVGIQDFRESMGSRKVYCPLRLELSRMVAWTVRLGVHNWGKLLGLHKVWPSVVQSLRATAYWTGSPGSAGNSRPVT